MLMFYILHILDGQVIAYAVGDNQRQDLALTDIQAVNFCARAAPASMRSGNLRGDSKQIPPLPTESNAQHWLARRPSLGLPARNL